ADLAVAAEILAEPALELVDERPDHALLHRHAKLQLADAIVERIGAPDVLVDRVLLVHVPQDPHASNLRARPGVDNRGCGVRANTGSSGPRPILGRVLLRLHIDNLALIERADLEPAAGLNVLTGETGAGKTMLAEAIGLLAGAQPAAGLVGPHGEEAYVEAEFELPDGFFDAPELEAVAGLRPDGEDTLVVARRLLASGRSRALVWGRTCARSDLEALGERLLEVSSRRWPRHGASGARPRPRSRPRGRRRPSRRAIGWIWRISSPAPRPPPSSPASPRRFGPRACVCATATTWWRRPLPPPSSSARPRARVRRSWRRARQRS